MYLTFKFNVICSFQDGSPFGKDKPAIGGGAPHTAASSSTQQHVHHHYHHADSGIGAQIAVPVPVPVPVGGSNAIGGNDFSQSSHLTASASSGFTPVSGSFGSSYNDIRPVSENLKNQGPATFGSSNSVYGSSGTFGSQASNFQSLNGGFSGGPNSGLSSGLTSGLSSGFNSGLSSGFNSGLNSGLNSGYNTGLNSGLSSALNSGYNSGLQGNYAQSQQYSQYQGYNTARQENFDCVCVPYEQCPAHEVIGRKDDLILPVDPRNLASDIEALTDEAVITDGNGTMTVVRVPKKAEDDAKDTKEVEEDEENATDEPKKISKRDVSDKKATGEDKANIEPVMRI